MKEFEKELSMQERQQLELAVAELVDALGGFHALLLKTLPNLVTELGNLQEMQKRWSRGRLH